MITFITTEVLPILPLLHTHHLKTSYFLIVFVILRIKNKYLTNVLLMRHTNLHNHFLRFVYLKKMIKEYYVFYVRYCKRKGQPIFSSGVYQIVGLDGILFSYAWTIFIKTTSHFSRQIYKCGGIMIISTFYNIRLFSFKDTNPSPRFLPIYL